MLRPIRQIYDVASLPSLVRHKYVPNDRAMSLEGNFAREIKRFLPEKWTESLLTMVNSITPDGPVQNFTSDLHSNEVKANAAQSERITSESISHKSLTLTRTQPAIGNNIICKAVMWMRSMPQSFALKYFDHNAQNHNQFC